MRLSALLALCAATPLAAQAVVVPASHSTAEGGGALWAPGLAVPLRQQILVDAAHLPGLAGRSLTGLQLRRNDHQRSFAAGRVHWSVTLSTATRDSRSASTLFADNRGADAVQVFQGTVTVPASPAPTAATVPWTADNTVAITFTTPFIYRGGTLCIELAGAADPNAAVDSWPIDAAWDPVSGSIVDVGRGCGAYHGGQWAFVEADTLVAGGTARFSAFGTPHGPAFFVIGTGAFANVIPLGGLGAPEDCYGHVLGIVGYVSTTFTGPVFPSAPAQGGMAVVQLPLPAQSWMLGAQFSSQWLDLAQPPFVASNAHLWTVAARWSGLGMATVMAREDQGTASKGEVLPGLAPVIRFDYR